MASITDGKAKGEFCRCFDLVFSAEVAFDERLETLGAEVKQFLPVVLLLLLRQTVFRLGKFELSIPLDSHKANTKVGAPCIT